MTRKTKKGISARAQIPVNQLSLTCPAHRAVTPPAYVARRAACVVCLLVSFALPACFWLPDDCNSNDLACGELAPLLAYPACPVHNWATFFGAENNSAQFAYSVATAPDGSIFVVGDSKAQFGSPLRPHNSPGFEDLYLSKYDAWGGLRWTTFYGGPNDDPGDALLSLKTTTDGVVLVGSGAFDDPAAINPRQSAGTTRNALYLGFDGNGQQTFSTYFGAAVENEGSDVHVFPSGDSVALAGAGASFTGSVGPLIGPGCCFGATDFGFVLYDGARQAKGHGYFGGTGSENPYRVAGFADGGFAIVGTSNTAMNAAFTSIVATGGGGTDIFIGWYSPAGVYRYHGSYGGSGNDTILTALPLASGSMIVIGQSDQPFGANIVTPHPGAGIQTYYILRLSPAGAIEWTTFMATSSSAAFLGGAVLTNDGDIVIAAGAQQPFGTPLNPHAGQEDVFVARVDADTGALKWHTFFGSAAAEIATSVSQTCDGGFALSTFSAGPLGRYVLQSVSPAVVPAMGLVKISANGQFP